MAGDTIYKDSGGTGDDDDEWLMTYFQPYRALIDRIPFFPCVGNHDTGETLGEGGQGDTLTLYDNLLVTPRFGAVRPGRDASITKGLFYRFRFGRDVEFICLDTSKDTLLFGSRMFEKDPGKTWMRGALATPLGSPKWRIPFSHHPPYCAGPEHGDTNSMRDKIIPLCVQNGVRAFISGHEHNFQCIDSEDTESARPLHRDGRSGAVAHRQAGKGDQWPRALMGRQYGHPLPAGHDRRTVNDHRADCGRRSAAAAVRPPECRGTGACRRDAVTGDVPGRQGEGLSFAARTP